MPPPRPDETSPVRVPSSLARLSYFYGQLLTQRDLESEQRYHLRLQRLAQRETFGTGTVAGLRVDVASDASRSVIVRAGLAMDPDGRELLLERDVCVLAVDEAVARESSKIEGTTAEALAESIRDSWDIDVSADDVRWLRERLVDAGYREAATGGDEDFTGLRDLLRGVRPSAPADRTSAREQVLAALIGITHVGIAYVERGAEPAPALLAGGCCDDGCHPSRVQQGVAVVASREPLLPVADPYATVRSHFEQCVGKCGGEVPVAGHDCVRCLCEHLLGAWRGLPPEDGPCGPIDPPVVPLARVFWSRGDHAPRILSIDNCSVRPLAPGVPAVRAMLEAFTRCSVPRDQPPLPVRAPKIIKVSPEYGAPVQIRPKEELVLRAVADARLAADAFTPTSWEIEIKRDDGSSEHWLGTVPADRNVHVDAQLVDDGGGRSSVELTVKSNLKDLPTGIYLWRVNVVGADGQWTLRDAVSGVALDGDPQPDGALPSGDGAPGGVFESRFQLSKPE